MDSLFSRFYLPAPQFMEPSVIFPFSCRGEFKNHAAGGPRLTGRHFKGRSEIITVLWEKRSCYLLKMANLDQREGSYAKGGESAKARQAPGDSPSCGEWRSKGKHEVASIETALEYCSQSSKHKLWRGERILDSDWNWWVSVGWERGMGRIKPLLIPYLHKMI